MTRFDIKTYELRAQYTLNLYDPSDYENLFRAAIEAQEAMETDPKHGMFLAFYREMAFAGLLYADWVSETPKGYRSFFDTNSLKTSLAPTTNGTQKSLVDTIGPASQLR